MNEDQADEKFLLSSLDGLIEQERREKDATASDPEGRRLFKEVASLDDDGALLSPEELDTIYDDTLAFSELTTGQMPSPRGEEKAEEGAEERISLPENFPTPNLKTVPGFIEASKVLFQKQSKSSNPYLDAMGDPQSDEEFGDWGIQQMSGFNWNIAKMFSMANEAVSMGDVEYAKALHTMIDLYDQSSGTSAEFGRGVRNLLLDPTTYLGLGVGRLAADQTLKRLGKESIKDGLKKQMSARASATIGGGVAGATEGGLLAGGGDAAKQLTAIEAGAQEDFSVAQSGAATAVGTIFGKFLGLGLGYGSAALADKLAAKAGRNQYAPPDINPEDAVNKALEDVTANLPPWVTATIAENSEHVLMRPGMISRSDIKEALNDPRQAQWAPALRRLEAGENPFDIVKDQVIKDVLDAGGTGEQVDAALAVLYAKRRASVADGGKLDMVVYNLGSPDGSVPLAGGRYTAANMAPAMDQPSNAAYGVRKLPGENRQVFESRTKVSDIDEEIRFSKKDDVTVKISNSEAGAVGLGRGISLYREFIGHMREKGVRVIQSDGMLSRDGSAPIYEKLKKIGEDTGEFEVRQTGKLSEDQDAVYLMSSNGDPIYEIVIKNNARGSGKIRLKSGKTLSRIGEDPAMQGLPIIDRVSQLLKGKEISDEVGTDIVDAVTRLMAEDDFSPSALREHVGLLAMDGKISAKAQVAIDKAIPETIAMLNDFMTVAPMEAGIQPRTATSSGTKVMMAKDGKEYEVVGKSERGGWWYITNDELGGQVVSARIGSLIPTGRPMEKFIGRFNASHLEDNNIRRMAEALERNQATPHRVQGWAETRDRARDLKKKGINVTNKKLEEHWSPEEVDLLATTYDALLEKLVGMAGAIAQKSKAGATGPQSATTDITKMWERAEPEDLAAFAILHGKVNDVRDLLAGVVSNAARILGARNLRPDSAEFSLTQQIIDSYQVHGGPKETMRAINAINEAAELAKVTGDDVKSLVGRTSNDLFGGRGWKGIAMNVRYNLMLSSVRTHVANFLGSANAGLYEMGMVHPTKITVNKIEYHLRKALSIGGVEKMAEADRLYWADWGHSIFGMFESTKESLFLAKEIAMGRDIGEGKIVNELGLRYHISNLPTSTAGKVGTTPMRLLEAMDSFFKNQYYNAKIHEEASQFARLSRTGQQDASHVTLMQRYIADPPQAAKDRAKEFASKLTFTNDPSIYGEAFGKMVTGLADASRNNFFLNMLFPFIRTPANLLGFASEMSGLSSVLRVERTLKALNGTAAERADVMARVTIAGGMLFYLKQLHSQNLITGTGPGNPEEKKAWQASGEWAPNSIKIGGRWYDLSRIEPGGLFINFAATMFDSMDMIEQDPERMYNLGSGMLVAVDLIKDRSFLSQFTDLIVAIDSQEENRAVPVIGSLVASYMVPNLMRDFRSAADPTERRMDAYSQQDTGAAGFIEQVAGRMKKQWQNAHPWASENLPARRDWAGNVMNQNANAYWRAVVPIAIRKTKQDKASAAIAYARISLSPPSRFYEFDGAKQFVKLDLAEMDGGRGFVQDKMAEFIGKARHELVSEFVNSSAYQEAAAKDLVGPGTIIDGTLRELLAAGQKAGTGRFIQWLGENDSITIPTGEVVPITKPFNPEEFSMILQEVIGGGSKPEGFEQYKTKEARPGPGQFKGIVQ